MMLRRLQVAILQGAALLVPARKRAEWVAEWRAELWYVNRRATAFCLGSFCDALWLDRNSPASITRRRFSLESPVRCVMFLAALTALSFLLAFGWPSHDVYPPPPDQEAQDHVKDSAARQSDELTPSALIEPNQSLVNRTPSRSSVVARNQAAQRGAEASPQTCEDFPIACLALCLVSLGILSSVTPLSLGEYPVNRYAPAAPIRMLRWIFLAIKISLLMPAAMCGCIALVPINPGLAPWAMFLGLSFGFRWALMDQRERCPVCLRLLSNPTRIGDPSQSFLGWYGTELMCSHGHGLLYVPGTSTSWFETQRWQYLDPSWSNLLP
jgi:hypothetical protein